MRQALAYQAAFLEAFDDLADVVATGRERAAEDDVMAAAMIGIVAMSRAYKTSDKHRSDRLLPTAHDVADACSGPDMRTVL